MLYARTLHLDPAVTSVLLLRTPDPGAPDLAADFVAAGFELRGQGDCAHLVRETLRAAPDVLVCWASRPAPELLHSVATLQAQQPVPVLFFTQDSAVETMQRALDAGVHAWVVQGYAPQRLRALVHLAIAREAHERKLRAQAAELAEKLEERKWVDKAKGILMRAQQVSEQEAFQLLRSASMQGNRRVGQLSRQVIDTARAAQAINRAGQQRMLSQRLVKLYALACSRTDAAAANVLMRESMQRVEDNLEALEADLSTASYGDLIAAARAGWIALRQGLEAQPRPAELARIDAQAEAVLAQANALVMALESSGVTTTAQVINVAGGLRWRSQRIAKLALLLPVAVDPAPLQAELIQTAAEFEDGLRALAAADPHAARSRRGRVAGAALGECGGRQTGRAHEAGRRERGTAGTAGPPDCGVPGQRAGADRRLRRGCHCGLEPQFRGRPIDRRTGSRVEPG
jgi:AmiR/NasT family two-component response regulator